MSAQGADTAEPEAQFGVPGGAEHVAQVRAVGRAGPAHRAAFVAREGVGVELIALAGGLPQPGVDGLGQLARDMHSPGARRDGSVPEL